MNAVPDWNVVRTFLVVAEHLHRGIAAERLGISVRTLSRHVAQLEQQLGVPLVTRTRQRTALTPSGVWLRDALRLPLAQANDALLQAARHTTPSTRMAISTELPTSWMTHVGAWVQESDHLVTLELNAPDQAMRRLRAGDELDIALVTGEPGDLPGEIVGDEPVVVVFPQDHPAAAHAAIQTGDLLDLPVAVSEISGPEHQRGILERLQGDPEAPSVTAPRMATIGQGLIQTARAQRAAALTLAAVTAQSDTAGLAVRPLDPPYRVHVSLVARAEVPDELLASLAAHLIGVPAAQATP